MKLQVPFLQLPRLFDAAALAAEIQALGEAPWRPHPQGYPGNSALTLITVGGDPGNERMRGAMQATPWLLRCPYLMQVLDSLGATWGRTRLMRLSGQAEVSPHVDTNYYWREHMRVHVPIVTQPTVRFYCGDAEVNMAAGECWIFDTWRQHRVVNDAEQARIHLVADTVGGDRFLPLLWSSRPHGRASGNWQPQRVAPRPDAALPRLDYERVNLPTVMTPWELREHAAFLLNEAEPQPALAQMQALIQGFSHRWQASWACYGEDRAGWPRYRQLLDAFARQLDEQPPLRLRNGVAMAVGLRALVLNVALADGEVDSGAEVRQAPVVADARAAPLRSREAAQTNRFDRPLFLLSPPRSGSTLLFETLAQAPAVYTIGDESHGVIEGITALSTIARGYDSNRLDAGDASPAIAEELRLRFAQALRDRDGQPPAQGSVRLLEKTPKNALRVPFLTAVFPDARFVYLHRESRQVLGSMIDAWHSGRFRTYPKLPGWTGLPWSLLLIPGWRELIGRPLGEIVAWQWQVATERLLDDLEQIPAARRLVVRYEDLVSKPAAQIERIARAMDLAFDRPLQGALPLSRYTLSPPDPDKWRRHAADIEPHLPALAATIARAEAFAAG